MRRAGAVSQGRATPGNGRQKSFPLNKVVLGEAILDAQTVNRMRGQSIIGAQIGAALCKVLKVREFF